MEKLTGKTADIMSENIEKIKQLFPEVFIEGKIDFDMLQKILRENVETDRERYGFTWHGKSDAIKMALKQTTGTLRPKKADSKHWDTTQNLFIEGDNLEVLRALQESYRGKIKMIYIDPPYNTGKDFVYEDNFNDNIKNYKEKVGDMMQANADTSGRFHTNWLNMMYPRLRLAKNLLRDDGVIFVSIDDNEAHNLRKLCDEIFCEENFIADITVVNNLKGRNDKRYIATANERLLMYVKSDTFEESGLQLPEERLGEFNLEDEVGKYRLLGLRKRGGADTREKRPKLFFPIYIDARTGEIALEKTNQFNIEVLPRKSDNSDGCWRWGLSTVKSRTNSLVGQGVGGKGKYDVFVKDYLETDGEIRRIKPKSVMFGSNYSSDGATKAFRSLLPEVKFDNPKPVAFLKDLISYSSSEDDDIILDFFAGSASTAHAIIQLNAEDGGNRKFIMIQIPEIIPENNETKNADYENIAEIAKERIRRAGEKIISDMKAKPDQVDLLDSKNKTVDFKNLDIGFKVFELDETNFKLWDPNTKDIERSLLDQLSPLKEERTDEDAVYEILLKYGIDLTTPITELNLAGKKVFSLADGYLLICLEKKIELDTVKEMAKLSLKRVVFYDDGFLDDTVKANAEQTLKKAGAEEIMVI